MTKKRKMDDIKDKTGKIKKTKIKPSPSPTSKSQCDVISNMIVQKKSKNLANTMFIKRKTDYNKDKNDKIKKLKIRPSPSSTSKIQCDFISNVIEQKKSKNISITGTKNNVLGTKAHLNGKTSIASGSKRIFEEMSPKNSSKSQEILDSTLKSECEIISKISNENKKDNFANFNHKNTSGANNWKTFLASDSMKVVEKKNNSKPQDVIGPKSEYSKRQKKFHVAKVSVIDKHNNQSQGLPSRLVLAEHKPKSSNHQPLLADGILLSVSKNLINKDLKSNLKCANNKERMLTKQIAMDCEMVGVEVGVNNSMVARVSLVNALGDCIYDKYVEPTEAVLSYRTKVSGITPKNLENATDFRTVQKEVADILKGKILVGHALKNDLGVLFLTHPKRDIRDTSKFSKFRGTGRTPALKKLAKRYLGVTIQEGEHNSVQDALAAMQLYRMFRREWEASLWLKKSGKPKPKDVRNVSLSQLQSEV